MEHNGKDEIMLQEEGSQCTSSFIEIKILTMDSQSYTIRVNESVSILELKEKIASVTGVVTEQQRLIFRGRALHDEHTLSSYHVQDGHTLHLAVRQPIVPELETSTSDPALSADIQRSQTVGHVYRRGTAESRPYDGDWLASATLNIETIIRSGGDSSSALGVQALSDSDLSNIMNQLLRFVVLREPIQVGGLESQQSLNEVAGRGSNSSREASSSEGSLHERRLSSSYGPGSASVDSLSSLAAEVLELTRQLNRDLERCIYNMSRQFEDLVNVTDQSSRRLCQRNIDQSGLLLGNLCGSLSVLSLNTMLISLGLTLDNAEPSGRNLLPVLGTNMGSLQEGTAHSDPFATPPRSDSTSAPAGRGLSDFRDRINQFLRVVSSRGHVQVGSSESQVETNEAVGMDEGVFTSTNLQQISQNEAEDRGNNSRQASSREEEEDAEQGDSTPSHQ